MTAPPPPFIPAKRTAGVEQRRRGAAERFGVAERLLVAALTPAGDLTSDERAEVLEIAARIRGLDAALRDMSEVTG